MSEIERKLYEYDYDYIPGGKVNHNCLSCLFFEKCISDEVSRFSQFVFNCKNYQSENVFFKEKIFKGGISKNETGELLFNNNLKINLYNIKRFYTVSLYNKNEFRGWHGHKNENKYCLCLSGVIKIGMVKINNFENPSKDLIPEWYILTENDCEILHIPGGYANGIMKIDRDESKSRILFFSDISIGETEKDDYRYDKDLWRIK